MDTSSRIKTEATFSDLEMKCTIEIKSRNGTRYNSKDACNTLIRFTEQVLRDARALLIDEEVLFNDANEVIDDDEAVGMPVDDRPCFRTICSAVVSAEEEHARGMIQILTSYHGSIDRLLVDRGVRLEYLKIRTLMKYGTQSQFKEFKVQVGGKDMAEDDTVDKTGLPEKTCFCIVPV